MGHRITIGGIFTECNQFGGERIGMDWFERYDLHREDEILGMEDGVVGGMLQALRERRAEIVPLLYAGTCPGGEVDADCYRKLKGELLERLRAALPVDGVLLPLHGAAVVEEIGDLEGDLLAAVRQVVGEDVPLVATLDLHAHVSEAMARHADGLVAWETYPHRDALTTGMRGARRLVDAPEGLDRCFFVSGGSEATESALKIARKYHLETGNPQKHKVISRWQSWHGNTIGALSMSGRSAWRHDYAP